MSLVCFFLRWINSHNSEIVPLKYLSLTVVCNWRFWSFQSLPASIGFLRKLQILYADENFLEGIPLEVCMKMTPYSYLLDECHVMFALACQQAPKWGHTWFVSLTNFLFCPTPFRHLFASYFCIKFLKRFFFTYPLAWLRHAFSETVVQSHGKVIQVFLIFK